MTLPDKDDIDTLGGIMADYEAVVDPTVDLAAAFHNKAMANIAAMTRTIPQALCRFTGHATTPTDPSTGFVQDSVWGADVIYKPSVVHDSTGVYDLSFPADVLDALGEQHLINFRFAMAWVEGLGTRYHADAVRTSSNEIRVYTYNAAGSANDAVGLNICVVVW